MCVCVCVRVRVCGRMRMRNGKHAFIRNTKTSANGDKGNFELYHMNDDVNIHMYCNIHMLPM